MHHDLPDTLFQLIFLTTLEFIFISPCKDEKTAKKLSLKQQEKKAFHLKNENVNLWGWQEYSFGETKIEKLGIKSLDFMHIFLAWNLFYIQPTIEKQSSVVVKVTVPEAKMPEFKFQLHHLQAAPAWEAHLCNSYWVPLLVFFFLITAVTNYCKIGGLKWHKFFYSSGSQKFKVGLTGLKSRISRAALSRGGSKGSYFLPSSTL